MNCEIGSNESNLFNFTHRSFHPEEFSSCRLAFSCNLHSKFKS
jgi:hypothetical protein